MTAQTSVIARIHDGSPALSNGQREKLSRFFRGKENKFVTLTVREEGKPRTHTQNNYLWAIYTLIGDWSGHTKEEVHSFCKEKFLGRDFMKIGEEEIQVPKSTKKLSTDEFGEYLDNVMAFAAENGVVIPTKEEFYNSLQ